MGALRLSDSALGNPAHLPDPATVMATWCKGRSVMRSYHCCGNCICPHAHTAKALIPLGFPRHCGGDLNEGKRRFLYMSSR